MSGRTDVDIELGLAPTSYITATMSAEEVLRLNYAQRLARRFFHPEQISDYDNKICTLPKLRRYNVARIQHDLLKVWHNLKTVDGGTEEDRIKLTSLLRDHSMYLLVN